MRTMDNHRAQGAALRLAGLDQGATPNLREVRLELDELVERRFLTGLSRAEEHRYEALACMEEDLIASGRH
jgi:hypothetical protein